MASAGRILIMPKGNYDASVTYEMLDLVSHNGKSWLAKKTVVGIEPSETNGEYWHNMVDVTPKSIGAMQTEIWHWVNNEGDSLLEYIVGKLNEGYTYGNIQLETTQGLLSDIPDYVRAALGDYFMCTFQRHHYGYVKASLWGGGFEFTNFGLIGGDNWSDYWHESECPGGYVPKRGGAFLGDVSISKYLPTFRLYIDDGKMSAFFKNAADTFDNGTSVTDISGNVQTTLTIQNGQLKLSKIVNGVEVGSKVIAEVTG